MSAYDAIDTTRWVDDSVYTTIVQKIANNANLKYTLEQAIKKEGAFLGLVNTFDLANNLQPMKLQDLEERLS